MQKIKLYGLAVLLCLLSKVSTGQTALPYVQRDKLTILDFWASWCPGCLRTLAHEDSLQAAFGDSLAIVLVNSVETRDDPARVQQLLLRFPHLFSVLGDTVATARFPHSLLPHCVWLFHDSVVAVTGPEALTVEHVRAMLAGQPVAMERKHDIPVDFTRPVLCPLGASSGSYVVLTGAIKGLPGSIGTYGTGDTLTGICGLNVPIPKLYEMTGIPGDFIEYHGDSAAYCYERVVPRMLRKDLYALARADLDRLFGLKGCFVNRHGTRWFVLQPNNH